MRKMKVVLEKYRLSIVDHLVLLEVTTRGFELRAKLIAEEGDIILSVYEYVNGKVKKEYNVDNFKDTIKSNVLHIVSLPFKVLDMNDVTRLKVFLSDKSLINNNDMLNEITNYVYKCSACINQDNKKYIVNHLNYLLNNSKYLIFNKNIEHVVEKRNKELKHLITNIVKCNSKEMYLSILRR